MFVTVIVCGTLFVPIVCTANVKLAGDKLNGNTAAPDRFTIWGLTDESSATATEPGTVPADTGVKVTENVQDAPAATIPLHGLAPLGLAENSPLAVSPVIVTELLPEFVAITLLATLVVPTITCEKLRVATEKVSGPAVPFIPTPVSPTTDGLNTPLYDMAIEPLTVPFTLGVNVTPIVHFAWAARLPPQGEEPFPPTA